MAQRFILPDLAPFFLQLKNDGYTVIPGILEEKEVDLAVASIWAWLHEFSGGKIVREDKQTWRELKDDDGQKIWPYTFGEKGIIQWYSATHTQWAWDLRSHPKVHAVFAEFWKDSNLIVSFDGMNLQRPPEIIGKYADPLGSNWLHLDQSGKRKGLETIQGFLNLEETGEKDGCLVLKPKSHLLHNQFFTCFPNDFENSGDFIKLQKEHISWYENRECATIRVVAPKGSLVLWDSRTVHANSTAQPGRADKDRFRLVLYVCYVPRDRAKEKELEKRQKYFEEGRMTAHFPHTVHVFPKKPYLRGDASYNKGFERAAEMFQQRPVKLTKLGRRLVGY